MVTNELFVPVYAINLPERNDRKEHILNQFKNRKEFDLKIVEGCRSKTGNMGLWDSLLKIIKIAVAEDEDVIIVCEDDHVFTPDYEAGYLISNIVSAYKQGADILSGGCGGYGAATQTDTNRFWVNWFYCTQFIVLFKRSYDKILNASFKDTDVFDNKLSAVLDIKMVIYPFISNQKDFGYSDCTTTNNNMDGNIQKMFVNTSNRLLQIIK